MGALKSQVRSGLAAGGNGIRTLGPPAEIRRRGDHGAYSAAFFLRILVQLDKHEDLLLRIGSDWRIARRKIMLDQSKNLTFSFPGGCL
jgi:hypothetical protein